ncbi:hypothetical protein Tco_1304200 [Tanacetum coccineum]
MFVNTLSNLSIDEPVPTATVCLTANCSTNTFCFYIDFAQDHLSTTSTVILTSASTSLSSRVLQAGPTIETNTSITQAYLHTLRLTPVCKRNLGSAQSHQGMYMIFEESFIAPVARNRGHQNIHSQCCNQDYDHLSRNVKKLLSDGKIFKNEVFVIKSA